jgi:hypothetical protein
MSVIARYLHYVEAAANLLPPLIQDDTVLIEDGGLPHYSAALSEFVPRAIVSQVARARCRLVLGPFLARELAHNLMDLLHEGGAGAILDP